MLPPRQSNATRPMLGRTKEGSDVEEAQCLGGRRSLFRNNDAEFAMGKGSGPIKLMNPRGHVLAVRGDAADRWWRYFKRAKCSLCDSARHAAVLLHRVESARLRRGGAPTYLFKPRFLGVSWPGAWVLYASTKRTPAYVVVRGGVADNGKQWDSWTPVTKRVERVLLRRSGVRTTTSSEVHAPASEPRRPLLPLVCGVAALSI